MKIIRERLNMNDFYTINLPVSFSLPSGERMEVLPESSMRQKRYVEKLALYFKREMHFDFLQFKASETKNHSWYVPYSAWLFYKVAHDRIEEDKKTPKRIYGACSFRWRYEHKNSQVYWELDWIWLHPYFRGQGYLKKHWGFLKQKFAPFYISQPLSPSMKRFLQKHDEDEFKIA